MFVFLLIFCAAGFGALALQIAGYDVGPRNWDHTAWALAADDMVQARSDVEFYSMVDHPTWAIDTVEEQRATLLDSIASLRTAMLASDPLVARLRTSDADRNRITMRVRSVSNARYTAGV